MRYGSFYELKHSESNKLGVKITVFQKLTAKFWRPIEMVSESEQLEWAMR